MFTLLFEGHLRDICAGLLSIDIYTQAAVIFLAGSYVVSAWHEKEKVSDGSVTA
jgi:hypothetical protein